MTSLSTIYLNDRPKGCTACPYASTGAGFVPSWVPVNPKVAFLAEAPGENEAAEREPMIGRSGQLLMRSIQQCGYTRNDVLIANVLGCKPPGNNYPTGKLKHDAEAYCRQWDDYGNKSLQAGGLNGFKPDTYLVALHPSFISRTWSFKRVFESDIAKAFRLYESGKRVVVLLGQKSLNLVIPDMVPGVSKVRGHHGPINWEKDYEARWK